VSNVRLLSRRERRIVIGSVGHIGRHDYLQYLCRFQLNEARSVP
jgi:hypothetical protein